MVTTLMHRWRECHLGIAIPTDAEITVPLDYAGVHLRAG